MITLNLDDEQAAMAVEAIESGMRMLDFRLRRADPDGIISASQKLQQSKLDQIKHQIRLGPVSEWEDLSKEDRQQFRQYCRMLADAKNADLLAGGYAQMVAFVTSRRAPHKAPDLPDLMKPEV